MRISDPLNSLSHAMTMARLHDLPPVSVTWKGGTILKRPSVDAIDVRLFMQSWPTTQLGFDYDKGIAGQAFTTAPTVVVMHGSAACVYFGERLAYTIRKMGSEFIQAMKDGELPNQSEALMNHDADVAKDSCSLLDELF